MSVALMTTAPVFPLTEVTPLPPLEEAASTITYTALVFAGIVDSPVTF
ncbi:hypothetical protein P2L35_13125 [Enterococcus faecium]|nr:hypothetical protein [Enterococcus faecium]MDN3040636.1 hypothetical protein [Enterococcus faecium]